MSSWHTLGGLVLLMVACCANAATEEEFDASYKAYQEALAGQRFDLAARQLADARKQAEELFADDARRLAVLAFNHGVALTKARRREEAFEVLSEAKTRIADAFGEDADELMQVEIALLDAVARSEAASHLRKALKRARVRHDEDSEYIADLKLHGAMRMWSRDSARMLEQAAATYQATGNRKSYGMAQFLLGRVRFATGSHRKAVTAFNRVIDVFPADDPHVLTARAHLVEAFEQLGESGRATEHCLAIGRTRPWTGHADYQPLFKKPPKYPQNALRSGKEGSVLLTFTVDESGFVRNPEIVNSEGGEVFHESALEAAKGFRYAPKFVDGAPVEVTGVLNKIIYSLR